MVDVATQTENITQTTSETTYENNIDYIETKTPTTYKVNKGLILNFGKYKNKSIENVLLVDNAWCTWLYKQPNLEETNPDIYTYLHSKNKDLNKYYIHWGKYKGKSLDQIAFIDPSYIKYLKKNAYVNNNCSRLVEELKAYVD